MGWWGRASEAQTTVSRGWLRKYLGWGENYTALHYSLFKSVGTHSPELAESGHDGRVRFTGVAQVVWYGDWGNTCCSQFDSNA